jgi:hypothetical protein
LTKAELLALTRKDVDFERNNCPKQAMTLLGKKIVEQSVIEKYL